jgi:hypothetical protein
MQENLSMKKLIDETMAATGAKSLGELCRKLNLTRNCAYNWKAGGRANLLAVIKMGKLTGRTTEESVKIWESQRG